MLKASSLKSTHCSFIVIESIKERKERINNLTNKIFSINSLFVNHFFFPDKNENSK